ncbi:DUF4129 domain-containing protein [Brevibacillus brevis]|uniref:DUF4129 domain-containing protein n=1 Tax=Brevibacillus brevis TaxID=1393 RepID=A0ABY9SXU5_BREBE|nr:DUF4129 domain-containing protein [Brevibacillus brevis]WNC12653.1 DUF4129 domain-containing protein [Brevibacillus brevis]
MSSGSPWAQDKEQLKEILSRDEFSHHGEQGESWLRQAMDQFLEKLLGLFQRGHLPEGTSSTVSTIILAAAAIGLIVLVFWLARRLGREQRYRQPLFSGTEKVHSYADYLREAKELGQRKQWREGERSLFLALLVYMQEKGWLRVEPWKTNWEYAEEIHYHKPGESDVFRTHAQAFERVWYGQSAVSEEHFWERWNALKEYFREVREDG